MISFHGKLLAYSFVFVMTIEQALFLNLLSDHLNQRKSLNPSTRIDWKVILYYAQIQQVEGIIFQQSKGFLPNELSTLLQNKYYLSIDSYTKREYLVKTLKKSLSAENIDCFIVKGFPVAYYYPLPPLRTMCDTDLVVHSENRHRVHEILLGLGYTNVSHRKNREWIYYKDVFELELHDKLVYNESINRKVHVNFLMSFWDYLRNGELDWSYHFIYLIIHLRKHLMNCGVGFRQFMDVAVVMRNCDFLDWNWIEEQLNKLELIDFSKTVFAFIETWFDIKSPLQSKVLDNGFIELVTEQVFNNGIFGFDNDENKNNTVVNNVRKSKNAKAYIITTALHTVLPSYNKMITIPEYSFLIGKKWLLPWAWFIRIIKGINRSRISENANVVKASFVSSETIEKRELYLKQWGLDELDQ